MKPIFATKSLKGNAKMKEYENEDEWDRNWRAKNKRTKWNCETCVEAWAPWNVTNNTCNENIISLVKIAGENKYITRLYFLCDPRNGTSINNNINMNKRRKKT